MTKTVTICGHSFEAVDDPADLRDTSGVYSVLDDRGTNTWKVLDVGESSEIRTRVQNHDRAGCWERHRLGRLWYAAKYMPYSTAVERRLIEKQIRDATNPPCGEY